MELFTLPLLLVALFSNYIPYGHAERPSKMELESVQVIFRHGERTPQVDEYNMLNYTNLSAYEPPGFGHLTKKGKLQAYNVGKMLRERYEVFLNDTDSSRDVYARSSELSRARMTLELVLAGLFPPSDELRGHHKLASTPIAYRYVPEKFDALLRIHFTPKFQQYYRDVWKTSWGLEKLALYKDIFHLFDELGIKVNKTDITCTGTINHLLQINERMNLSLPDWYKGEMKQRLAQASELFDDSMSYTQQLKKINGGLMVRTFIDKMNINGSAEDSKKLYLYSGHDTNIAGLVRALKVEGFVDTDFCSTFIFEKWRNSKNQIYVRLLHWNAIKEEMSIARMGNCKEFCPIDSFLELSRDVIPTDEELFSVFDQYDINYVKKSFH